MYVHVSLCMWLPVTGGLGSSLPEGGVPEVCEYTDGVGMRIRTGALTRGEDTATEPPLQPP